MKYLLIILAVIPIIVISTLIGGVIYLWEFDKTAIRKIRCWMAEKTGVSKVLHNIVNS
jgi:hypothetical protein